MSERPKLEDFMAPVRQNRAGSRNPEGVNELRRLHGVRWTGEQLKRARLEDALSIADAAALAGVSKSTYRKFETGKKPMSSAIYRRFRLRLYERQHTAR